MQNYPTTYKASYNHKDELTPLWILLSILLISRWPSGLNAAFHLLSLRVFPACISKLKQELQWLPQDRSVLGVCAYNSNVSCINLKVSRNIIHPLITEWNFNSEENQISPTLDSFHGHNPIHHRLTKYFTENPRKNMHLNVWRNIIQLLITERNFSSEENQRSAELIHSP